MRRALEYCGYQVEVLDPNLDVDSLGERLREFCHECDNDDVHLIYFSGHGLAAGGRDFIVPAGIARDDAYGNENARVKTNLSDFVSEGLVVFIIDACRDSRPLSKGGEQLGYEAMGGEKFVGFFGCSRGETCQVMPEPPGSAPVSMFTAALEQSLTEGEHYSLRSIRDRAAEICSDLGRGTLQVQRPHLSHGESTRETDAMLDRPIFEPALRLSIWSSFDPDKMHCLVITSEYEFRNQPQWTLDGMVRLAMAGKLGRRVWPAFTEYANGRESIADVRRRLPDSLDSDSVQYAAIHVHDAFQGEGFADVVRALVEADIVVFDVSQFEPGMMVLMGIRSACRRGVSVCTAGGGWRELDEIDIPFNLRDLSLGSHTESEGGVQDLVTHRFVERIELGFRQMTRQPQYQDLPAYHALRQLGPEYEASSDIPAKVRVLILASYGDDYKDNWRFLKNTLEGCLEDIFEQGNPQVVRLIDLGNPQLVSQSLYEQIRRSEGCVVDWTRFSPSTFFELGVRLAVSEWGAIQIIDERYLPGGSMSDRWKDMSKQITAMARLFEPLRYDMTDPKRQEEPIMAAAVVLSTPDPRNLGKRSMVNQRVSDAMSVVAEKHPPVHQHLKDTADSLRHPDREQMGASKILFRNTASDRVQRASEAMAMELRIAAWLYLHYRLQAGKRKPGDPLCELYQELGRESSDALSDAAIKTGEEAELILANEIEDLIKAREKDNAEDEENL